MTLTEKVLATKLYAVLNYLKISDNLISCQLQTATKVEQINTQSQPFYINISCII